MTDLDPRLLDVQKAFEALALQITDVVQGKGTLQPDDIDRLKRAKELALRGAALAGGAGR